MMQHGAVYCDFNASTPLRPCVQDMMQDAQACFGNPSSVHHMGRRARGYVDRARDQVAQALQAHPQDVVFTSGGSEANNTILHHARLQGAQIFVSAIEHDSVLQAAPDAHRLPVTSQGVVDVASLAHALQQARTVASGAILVAVMYANNETGALQPIAEIAELTRRYGAHLHCDAVQALGKIALDYGQLGADSLALSAHKIGGPKGVGAYIVRPQMQITPLIHGGGQERGNRAGTENVAGIAGFGAAIAACAQDDWGHVARLRDQFECDLQHALPTVRVHSAQAPRLPNTSCFSMPGVTRLQQDITFDAHKICIGAGSACASGKAAPSHVLMAMGCDAAQSLNAARVSLGCATTSEDVAAVLRACTALYSRTPHATTPKESAVE